MIRCDLPHNDRVDVPKDPPAGARRRLKILHVISTVNPAYGGPIEGVKQMGMVNSRLGHQIEVASLDEPSEPFTRDFPLRLHTFGPSRLKFRYSPRLVPWIRDNHSKYDAVIVNGIWQYNSFAVWRALQGTKTPYFVYPHGMLDPWFKRQYPLKHLKKWLYWPWGQYPVLRDARAVLFTCEEERRLARESFWLYKCAEVPVNYGTAAPGGDPEEQRAQFLAEFPQLRERRVITFLGRIHEKKGCDLLLQALANIRNQMTQAGAKELHAVIAGPDQTGWVKQLRSLATHLELDGHVTWLGMVAGDRKWGLLRASEAFILPSHQENFGIAVAEALACSLPALVSDKVNIWREIVQDSAGFAEKDDLAGTCELLRRWVRLSPEDRAAMRVQARRCFESRFEIQQAARSLVNVISRALPA